MPGFPQIRRSKWLVYMVNEVYYMVYHKQLGLVFNLKDKVTCRHAYNAVIGRKLDSGLRWFQQPGLVEGFCWKKLRAKIHETTIKFNGFQKSTHLFQGEQVGCPNKSMMLRNSEKV